MEANDLKNTIDDRKMANVFEIKLNTVVEKSYVWVQVTMNKSVP